MRRTRLCLLLLFAATRTMLCLGASPADTAIEESGFMPLLAPHIGKSPLVLEGGHLVVVEGDEWMVIGVGTGAGDDKDVLTRSAWRVAEVGAMTALAEALEGGGVLSGGDDLDEERFRSLFRVGVNGIVSGSREAVRWANDGRAYVMRIAFSPGHPGKDTRREFTAEQVTLIPPWRNEFLTRPFLRNGGVDIAFVDGDAYLLVVGVASVKNGTAQAKINASRVANVKAQAQFLEFYDGIRIKSIREVVTETRVVPLASHAAVEEKLIGKTQAQIKGAAAGMTKAGEWLSTDGKQLAAAYRLRVDDL